MVYKYDPPNIKYTEIISIEFSGASHGGKIILWNWTVMAINSMEDSSKKSPRTNEWNIK